MEVFQGNITGLSCPVFWIFFLKKIASLRYTCYIGIYLSTVENVGVYDPDLFEGDMILTPEQRMAAEKGLDVDNLSGRASIKSKLWPNGVMNYEIDSSLCKYLDIDLF